MLSEAKENEELEETCQTEFAVGPSHFHRRHECECVSLSVCVGVLGGPYSLLTRLGEETKPSSQQLK